MFQDDISRRIGLLREKIEESRSALWSQLGGGKENHPSHYDQAFSPKSHSRIRGEGNLNKFRPEEVADENIIDEKCLNAWDFLDNFGDTRRIPQQREQFRSEIARRKEPDVTHFKSNRETEIEIFAEKCSNACNFWDSFGRRQHQQDMVRVGEFSPQNPNLQTTGRSLLGLGEYEERRRLLLQRKREEYAQEMAQIAQKSSVNHSTPPSKPQKMTRDCCTQTDLCLLVPGQPLSVEVQSSTLMQQKPSLLDVESTSQALPEMVGSTALCRSPSPSSPGGGMSEARLRQLRHQEDLRRQIEEKHRLEAERREKEAREEEALARRVAEQQARLQAEFEEEERLRRQKEREKHQQTEEFLRRQEQLLLESEQLKLEQRRKRMEALTALAEPTALPAPSQPPSSQQSGLLEENPAPYQEQIPVARTGASQQTQGEGVKPALKATKSDRPGRKAHLVPPGPAAPISILKSTSPPPRSPREQALVRADVEPLEPPSPRALIKVLEGPTIRPRKPRSQASLEDSLPIPLLRQTRTPSPSPCRRPTPSQKFPPVHSRSNPNSAVIQPSEAMLRLEDKWKVPAVQKNVMTKRKAGHWGESSGSHVVLTQLGSFRRQLQEEHMRMEEKVRDCSKQAVS